MTEHLEEIASDLAAAWDATCYGPNYSLDVWRDIAAHMEITPAKFEELHRTIRELKKELMEETEKLAQADRRARAWEINADHYMRMFTQPGAKVQTHILDHAVIETLGLSYLWLSGGYPAQAQDVLRNALLAAEWKINPKFAWSYQEHEPADKKNSAAITSDTVRETAERHAANKKAISLGADVPGQDHRDLDAVPTAYAELEAKLEAATPAPALTEVVVYKALWDALHNLKIQEDAPVAPHYAVNPPDLGLVVFHASTAIMRLIRLTSATPQTPVPPMKFIEEVMPKEQTPPSTWDVEALQKILIQEAGLSNCLARTVVRSVVQQLYPPSSSTWDVEKVAQWLFGALDGRGEYAGFTKFRFEELATKFAQAFTPPTAAVTEEELAWQCVWFFNPDFKRDFDAGRITKDYIQSATRQYSTCLKLARAILSLIRSKGAA